MLSLFSKLLLELLRKLLYRQKRSLNGISRLLSCLNRLLVDSGRNINRGSTHISSSGRPNSLRRFRFLNLFFSRWHLSLSANLFRRWLLCSCKWVISIGHLRLLWRRSLGLLLLFLFGDGGLISRRWSSEVDWLFDHVFYCPFGKTIILFAGLPILQVAWQHYASVRCLWLL